MNPRVELRRQAARVAKLEDAAAQREDLVLELVRSGLPTEQIAADARVSTRRVRQIAIRHGLGRPTRGRPPKPKNGGGE